MRQIFFRNKTVTVVGGGDSAIEESLYLAKLARQVYIIHRRDQLRAGALLQQRARAECKIEFIWNSVVGGVKANADGVYAVDVKNTRNGETRELATDGLFIFIGFVPNNRLVPAGIKRNADGYVMTDEQCATTILGSTHRRPVEKYRQIVVAAVDGAAAWRRHYVNPARPRRSELPESMKSGWAHRSCFKGRLRPDGGVVRGRNAHVLTCTLRFQIRDACLGLIGLEQLRCP
jgi:thioredoxin reductase (NADPH)